MERTVLGDGYGKVNIWMLPYFRRSDVRQLYPDKMVEDYDAAMELIIRESGVDFSERNVLLAHQYFDDVNGFIVLGDSEENAEVGGLDRISPRTVERFDYVALGHIHRAQKVRDNVWYSGTPLPYSEEEGKNAQFILKVDLGAKGDLSVEAVETSILRRVITLQGGVENILTNAPPYRDDYVYIKLEYREGDVDMAAVTARLRDAFDRILRIEYRQAGGDVTVSDDVKALEGKSETEVFSELFEQVTGSSMTQSQIDILRSVIEDIRGADE